MKPSLLGYVIDTYAQATAGSTGEQFRVNFDYFPESYREAKNAQYATIDVMGRSEPIRGYASSGARIFQINFQVAIDVVHGINPGLTSEQVSGLHPTYGTAFGNTQSLSPAQTTKLGLLQDKTAKLDFLLSLLYPHYDSTGVGMIRTPPPVLVIIGSYFAMLGIVENIEFTHKAPYDFDTGISHITEVSMVVSETAANPFSYLDIRNGLQSKATLPPTT